MRKIQFLLIQFWSSDFTLVMLHSIVIGAVTLFLDGPPWVAFLASCFTAWAHCVLKAVIESRPKISFNMSGEDMEVHETVIDKDGNVHGPRKL